MKKLLTRLARIMALPHTLILALIGVFVLGELQSYHLKPKTTLVDDLMAIFVVIGALLAFILAEYGLYRLVLLTSGSLQTTLLLIDLISFGVMSVGTFISIRKG